MLPYIIRRAVVSATRNEPNEGLPALRLALWRVAPCLLWLEFWCARFAIAIAMAFIALPAHADTSSHDWKQDADSTFRNVLSTATPTNAIVKTPDGFLWLGMQDGLVRWDGYRQKTYSVDPSVPGSLPSPDIQTLHVDRRGTLWVATHAGLAKYDRATDHFDVPFRAPGVLNDGFIHGLAEDTAGHLWVGTSSGLELIDLVTLRVHPHAEYAGPAGLPAGLVQALLVDRRERVWVATPLGMYVRHASSTRFERVALPETGKKLARVTMLTEDGSGRIWIGTASREVYVLPDGDIARLQPLSEFVPEAALLITEHGAGSICEVQPGEVWIGTDHGIVQIDTQRRKARRAVHMDRVSGSLPDDYIYGVYRDPAGLVWVSMNSGIAFSVVDQPGILTLRGQAGNPTKPAYSDVVQLLAHPNGTLWFGLADGGIDILNLVDGDVRHVKPDRLRSLLALPAGRVRALEPGPSGSVYIGTDHGLYVANAEATALRRLSIPGRLDTDAVQSLSFHAQRLWLGAADGLWGLEQASPGRMKVTAHMNPDQIMGHTVSQIYADEDGHTLWVGAGTGLMSVDLETMSVKRLTAETSGNLGIPKGHVTSMLKDGQGRLWVGLYGLGIRVLDLHGPDGPHAIRRVTKAEGLTHNGVNKMLLDDAGDVWLSTDDGLARVHTRDLEVVAFTAADGLGNLGYWTSAGARTADNLLVFGGISGITVVNPAAIKSPTRLAPIVITEVRAGDAENAAMLPVAQKRLILAPGQRALMVEYAVLDLTAPAENRYEYRLRGLDETWKTTSSSRRLAAYTNLPPGNYVLELRGADRHKYPSASTEIAVEVLPAWYETIWLKLGVGLVVFMCIFAFMHLKTLLLRQRERELQMLVDQRTQQLQASQQQLEQLAYFDPLTGLGNRRLFSDEFRRLLAVHQRSGGCFALLLIDLNKFKPINDTYGHDAGDAVLVATAKRLQVASREADRVARLGGDEFGILLEGVDTDAAVQAAQRRIVESLEPPISHGRVTLHVSASFGAALFLRDGSDEDTLFKAADVALYRMKSPGERSDQRLSLEATQDEIAPSPTI